MIRESDLSITGNFPVKDGKLQEFLDAATVWINKPHVANKRLSGTKIVQIRTADSLNTVDEMLKIFLSNKSQNTASDCGKTHSLEVDLRGNEEKFVIIVRELHPKQLKAFPVLLEAVIYDQSSQRVTFLPLCYTTNTAEEGDSNVSSEVAYCFTFLQQDDGNSTIQLSCSRPQPQESGRTPHAHSSLPWLRDTLAPKLQRWTQQSNLSTAIRSLRLVGVDRYAKLYSELKDKYGAELVKNWTESTDPQKFVYEDIGIAAYLLLIWEEDRQGSSEKKKQSFVDLGCGNGLLVYILTKEGHPGLGIDLRKRNIWNSFGSDVKLEERSITPSADNLFPEFDWIIGNHSDELTPWIPVIAARSSYTCSYFVLPCCLHDFNCRFNNKVKGESNYRSYLTYVGQVGEACGFRVEEDTLRIPSTKRVCQIGRHRTYPPDQEAAADQQRQEFINKRCTMNSAARSSEPEQSSGTHPQSSATPCLKRAHGGDGCEEECGCRSHADSEGCDSKPLWTESFQARSDKEQVRNCQKVGQAVKGRVVRAVFDAVLTADDATEVTGQEGRRWRKGGSVHLGTVAGMLDAETRDDLKSECGGVQTLLRNHSNIFQVSGGRVQLRDFSVDDPWSPFSKARKARRSDPATRKVSLCWFHSNHPDGCPRTAANCSFAHGEGELRPREVRKTER
ncbi:putative tRNA (uracil-O(2)-)-methyltransferase [Babylonia areolata]|uniref:putative tRNA (uracil-O(2)-)-methyltransferase n=1 Tax=Babylonia areolata TaxID=304850 RepID=UPI003FD42F90